MVVAVSLQQSELKEAVTDSSLQISHFTNEATEDQKREMTCSRSHTQLGLNLVIRTRAGLNPRCETSKNEETNLYQANQWFVGV